VWVSWESFAEAQEKAVDKRLPVGGWQVYRGSYEPWWYEEEHNGETGRYPFLQAEPVRWMARAVPEGSSAHEAGYRQGLEPDFSGVEVYSPLAVDDLFIQFATLFGDGRVDPFDPETIKRVSSWVDGWGVLGRHGTYPTPDGGMVQGRFDDREEVLMFVRLAVEANRVLRLFSAATEPGGPNVEKLRALSVEGDAPEQIKRRSLDEIDEAINKHLENETFTRLYRSRDDGKPFRGPGFHSLLGALWLQMSNLRTAPEEDIKWCRWCGVIITFEAREEPPVDAPKGTRGKYGTRTDREFCKEKDGVKDRCKNRYNYDQRKAGR
jgi:hypothetical protein